MMKRLLRLLLAMVFCVILSVGFTQAAHAATGSGTWGNLSWTLDSNGVLTISGSGAMNAFGDGESTQAWNAYKSSIKSVVINSGVTTIGSFAFSQCRSLRSVSIPSSVNGIAAGSFSGCFSLESIDIPASVTQIGIGAFVSSGLKNINVDSQNPSYSDVNGVLFDKYKTKLFTFPAGRAGSYSVPAGVEAIWSYAFGGCWAMDSVVIPEGVETIAWYAFSGCSDLKNITIPASMTTIETQAFNGCESLSNVYYGGTQSQWNAIDINSDNTALLNASIQYSSAMVDHYRITYNANGGSGAPASQTKTQGQALTLSSTVPTRSSITESYTVTFNANGGSVSTTSLTGKKTTSYTFKNWNTSSNGSGTSYAPGASYTKDAGVTLYAQWESSVSYNPITLPNAIRSGYAFKGWDTNSSASSGTFGTIMPTQNVTVYAIWSPSDNLAAEGTWGNLSWTLDKTGLLEISGNGGMDDFNPEYQFAWHTYKSSITNVIIQPGVTNIGEGAFFDFDSLRTVSIPDTVTKVGYGAIARCDNLSSVILPASVTRIDNGGFAECGNLKDVYYGGTENQWNAISMGGYNDSLQSATIHYNSTGPAATYTVTYNANGGSGAPASQTKTQGQSLTLSATKPTRSSSSAGSYTVTLNANGGSVSSTSLTAVRTTSYTFKNWNTVANGSGTSYASGASFTTDANTTLYAQWNSNTSTASVTLPTPTRDGYTFNGWATSSSASSGATGSYTPSGNVTLYAVWNSATYTVTYNANGGSGAPASQTKTQGQSLTLSTTKPTRADSSDGSYTVTLDANGGSVSTTSLTSAKTISYTFKDWNTAADGSGTSYASGASFTTDANTTLYAQWNSSTSTASVTLPIPTRDGYSFEGWATSSSASSGTTGSYTPSGNVTLYAVWVKRDVYASGSWDNLNWTLTESGLLTISGTGTMNDFVGAPTSAWLAHKGNIKAIEIESGVTIIGGNAFMDCSRLTSVTIPEGVTSIGSSAFSSCKGLTSVTIPEGVTSIGNYAFDGCSRLTSVTIPEGVTSIGEWAFSGCSSLTSAGPIGSGCDYQFGWTSTIPANAFRGCSGLTSVTIPDSVTSIGNYAFDGCSGLTKVHINSLSAWCSIAFKLSTSNPLRYAHNLYIGGDLVQKLIIPDSVTSIGNYTFYGCSSLTSVTIPSSVTSIGKYAFDRCSSLTSVTIPEGVTSIGIAAFSECSGLNAVRITSLEAWCKISFGDSLSNPLFYANNLYLNDTLIQELTIPEGVTSIGNYAFYGCSGLTSVTIPSSVTRIQSGTFSSCSSLTSVTIPESVTSIGNYAFYNCSSLKNVFYGGSPEQWSSITIGSNNTPLQNATIIYKPDLILPAFLTTIEDEAFEGGAFTYVKLPEGAESIGYHAFAACPKLRYISIPDGCAIDGEAFAGVSGLTILGKTGGSVQTWAGEHGYTFLAVD